MLSLTTKVIAAATVVAGDYLYSKVLYSTIPISGIATVINLAVIISLFVEIGDFQSDIHWDMMEFNVSFFILFFSSYAVCEE